MQSFNVYDSLNRIIEIHYLDKIIHYTYDAAGNRSGMTVEVIAAAPAISGLAISQATVGSNSFTLTVNGSNFTSASVVMWNGSPRSTTFVNANQLSVVIPASDLAAIGTAAITIYNPGANAVSNPRIFTVQSGASGCVAVSVASQTAAPNNTITIPVSVGDLTNRGIAAYDFTLSYNPSVLRPVDNTPVETSGTLSGNFNITTNTAAAGQLRVGAYGTSPLTGAGTLLNLKFTVIGTNGANSPLNWSQFQFNEGDPCSSPTNGQISVSGSNNQISGSVTYGFVGAQGVKNVPNVTLTANGAPLISTLTDGGGNYTLAGLGIGNYTVTLSKSGDVNSITSFDASLVARHAAGLVQLSTVQQIAADATNNGAITSLDAARIAQTAVGIANTGIAGQWKFIPASKNYPSLPNSLSGENYQAVLIGEVSGNWTAPPNSNFSEFSMSGAAPKSVSLAAATINVSLPAATSAAKGSIVTIPITVSDLTNQGVLSYDFDVRFDSTVLQPDTTPTDKTGTLSQNFTITPNAGTVGSLVVSGFGTAELAGAGTLLNLRFKVVGSGGANTNLTFQSFAFNEGDPAAAATNGQFTVTGPTAAQVSVEGRVLTAAGRGIKNAVVVLTDSAGRSRTAWTGSFGNYSFANVPPGAAVIIKVSAKHYLFDQPVQILNLNEDIGAVNFRAK